MPLTRRDFIRQMLALGLLSTRAGALLAAAAGCASREEPAAFPTNTTTVNTPAPTPRSAPRRADPPEPAQGAPYLSIVHGDDPGEITRRAVQALGGIERIVRPGQKVLIKPNVCYERPPEYAITTNPQVVAALVSLCLGAGAAAVKVMDRTFRDDPVEPYKVSGIQDAVQSAGGEMVPAQFSDYVNVALPDGVKLTRSFVARYALEADVIIDVPVLKHHAMAMLTLAAKNLMGLIYYTNELHDLGLSDSIVDLVSLLRPTLTVVDAYRVLTRWGIDASSKLSDVELRKTVIASHDIVAADACAASFFGMEPDLITYVKKGAQRGLGRQDWQSFKVEELSI